ncbi:helix-turn-helix transcriptional regulator [Ferruginibacter sp. HRS2-29]|uniref:helix-turn-helix domain-containing protein n=1 Tax=Ferruginibacter sp. HRS2-29 TaxID=2487334 RepID=UPI0020CF0C46|nr:helix-turn-helix transcriptional regulator [Ferruginibacter sp. HRS2-29]MCP9750176.1 XRE family transcriptional regulator [Ferruginibacter sp. HRS2-29]
MYQNQKSFLNWYNSSIFKKNILTLRQYRKMGKLTQQAMAELLKTTRTQINMAERGLRNLPPKAAQRLDELIANAGQAGRMPAENQIDMMTSEQMLGFQARDIWEELLVENHIKLTKYTRQLQKMEQKFNKSLSKSKRLWEVVEKLSSIGGAKAEIDYFDDRQKDAEKQLHAYGPVAQLRTQLQIDLILAERKLLKEYLNPATKTVVGELIGVIAGKKFFE